MPTITPIKRRDSLILIGILLLAGWMRLGRAGIVEYFHDDAMLATLALEMADGERFPITGILSSTGIPNPPTSVYVMAIPFSISSDPNTAIHFVMLLNVVGVGLLWLIAHRYFGLVVGIVAGILYAVNPWAVLFSRKIWAQDFHTPFILLGIFLLLYGFYEIQQRSRSKILAQIFAVPILLFAFQIHFAAWALTPIILIILWVGRNQIYWRALFVSLVLCVLTISPYLLGLTQTLETDPTRITDAAGRSTASDGISLTAKSVVDTVFLSSGYGLETWVAPDQQTNLQVTYQPFVFAGFVMTAIMLLGIVIVFKTNLRLLVFLCCWAFLPQIALIPNWTPVYIHYFIPSIPAMMLIVGVGAAWVMSQSRITWTFGIFIGVVLVASQIVTWHRTLDFLEINHVPYPGFTTPIADLNELHDDLKDSDDVLVISQGMAWNLHHEVAVWDTLLWDDVACVRTMIGDGYAVFPAQPFDVVIAPDAPADPVANLYQTDQPVQFDTRIGDNGFVVYEWDTTPNWAVASINPIDPILFDNAVQLTGYALSDSKVYLEWQLPQQTKGADYQYSAQSFDANGNRVAQLDKTFWHGRHWCEDDRLITWGALPLESNTSTLRVSMYQLGTGKLVGQFFNAEVLDELGNPAGQYAEIVLDENR